jgi:hypothetical protein
MFELADDALLAIGQLFIEAIQDKLDQKIYPYGNPSVRGRGDKVATGNLLKSLKVKLLPWNAQGQGGLQITYLDYFQNVNFGRRKNTKNVPIKNLLDWIKVRGIRGRNKKGKYIKDLSLAFAIQKNIYKYGIRAANIYDKGLDGLEEMLSGNSPNTPPDVRAAYQELYAAIENDVANFVEAKIIEIPVKN